MRGFVDVRPEDVRGDLPSVVGVAVAGAVVVIEIADRPFAAGTGQVRGRGEVASSTWMRATDPQINADEMRAFRSRAQRADVAIVAGVGEGAEQEIHKKGVPGGSRKGPLWVRWIGFD